jgi:hypothetical protein
MAIEQEFEHRETPAPESISRPKRVNIHDVQELRYWTKQLGVSSDMLVSAVRAVGHDPAKVEDFLRRKAS